MRVFKRLALSLLVLVVVTAIALAVWEPLVAESGKAPASRKYDVEIVRDDFGVPHIFGKTDADVAYGVAYAHSEDDFSTIQEVAAMTRARTGAMTGQDGAKVDFAAHLLDIRGTVDRKYDTLPADIRALLDAYAAGLNHYADKHPEEVRLSGLFPLEGRDIAAGFVLRSPFFFGLDSVLGALVEGKDLPIEGGPKLSGKEVARVTPIGPEPDMNGSNAFAVAPARSTDNVTRLISNSHQPWRGGVAWYELVVHSEEGWDFAGATFPGSPYPFLGHNKYLGWTNTVNRPDLIDVYKLELNDDRTQYRLDGQWRDLESQRVWLKVKMGPFTLPVPQTVYRSVHGPVILNDKGAFAIRYAGIDELKMLEQYFRINKARDFAEWQKAMAIQGVPATNFIYADAKGNIAMAYNALFPARKPGANWRGVLPGDRSDLIWKTHLPWDRVPLLVNPASGYIMNANNTPFVAAGPGDELDRASFSALMGIEDDMTNRARQAIKLFEAAGQIDAATLARIKYDVGYDKSDYATGWINALLAVKPDGDKRIPQAQALLRAWDWQMDGKGKGDALALMLMRPAMRQSYRRLPLPDPREELVAAIDHLEKYFRTLDPKLGTVLRLRQGKVDLPMDGGSDTLRAATLWDVDEEDGRFAVRHGDSFIQFVEWDKDGNVSSRSIQPFGAATTRPDSPHYADQAKLFVEHQTKPVYFTRQALMPHAKRRYRP
ncbi:acylase [Sphingomonas ursincola]|uniref:Acylase n=1 Tax=Sphingomonas ursincola TaxID=56361 RepID=A0A7V8U815_9SPHN|nr:acylase [Sphingomonas ursincola]MBA1373569.1 acylase [Sphingomonas ursincola]